MHQSIPVVPIPPPRGNRRAFAHVVSPGGGAFTIKGLRAKRTYIEFWADFHFLQDRANFWQTDLF